MLSLHPIVGKTKQGPNWRERLDGGWLWGEGQLRSCKTSRKNNSPIQSSRELNRNEKELRLARRGERGDIEIKRKKGKGGGGKLRGRPLPCKKGVKEQDRFFSWRGL